jgi:hypothetical protein
MHDFTDGSTPSILPACNQPEHAPSSPPSVPPLPEVALPKPLAEVEAKLRVTILYDYNEYDLRLETKEKTNKTVRQVK